MGGRSTPRTRGPLHLTPLLVEKPWGGRRLAAFGRRLPAGRQIGESWEVADLDPMTTTVSDPVTRVAAGPLTGRSLSEVIAEDRDALLGSAPDLDGRFPLLNKLLDAREHLSIQVHPPAGYVRDHPDVSLKTESWVVIDAEPGAVLFLGVAEGVDLEMLGEAVGTPAMVPLLRRVPAIPGQVHHLPAGTIHALGAGVLVAEVQTPSDTTFRVYDWTDEYDRAPRELHLEAAMRCIELGWEHNVAPLAQAQSQGTADDVPGAGGDPASSEVADVDDAQFGSVLVSTAHYELVRHRLGPEEQRMIEPGTMQVVQVLEGGLECDDFAWPLGAADSVVLPASWDGRLRSATATTTWLAARVPERSRA